jgi:hypothetical protein
LDSSLFILFFYEQFLDSSSRLLPIFTFECLLTFLAIATISPLTSLIKIPESSALGPIEVGQKSEPAYCHNIVIEAQAPEGKPWFYDIKRYLEGRKLPTEASQKEKRMIQRLAFQYIIG